MKAILLIHIDTTRKEQFIAFGRKRKTRRKGRRAHESRRKVDESQRPIRQHQY